MKRLSVLFLLFTSLIISTACSEQQDTTDTGQETPEAQDTQETPGESPGSEAQESEEQEAVDISANVEDRLVKYFKSKFGTRLPQNTTVSVAEIESADVPGFDKGNFNVNISGRGEQQIPFLVTEDRKYLVIGVAEATNIGDFTESPVKGYRQGEVQYGNRSLPVLVSEDGNYMLVGELLDSTEDPFKKVMDNIDLDNVPVKGNENAKVRIVEYSDFQCPFCKRGSQMLPDLLDQYGDNIAIYYKQLPLPNHNWAKQASVASLCVYQQGNDKFWEFHDKVFENQSNINLENAEEKFSQFASDIGLDKAEFESCTDSQEIADRVESEMREAQQLGVNSTPTFVVDGMIVPGADINAVKNAIDSRLSE